MSNPPAPRFRNLTRPVMLAGLIWCTATTVAQDVTPLSGTKPLTMTGDLSAQMVEGIDRFLLREIGKSIAGRAQYWQRARSSPEAYTQSVEPNRQRLRAIIGAVDKRLPMTGLELVGTTSQPAKVAETDRFTVFAVRWPVLDGVQGEGLLLEPKGGLKGRVVVIPDADQTPEMIVGLAPGVKPESQTARRLAEAGYQVVVPVLIDRRDNWSGSESLNRFTNQPHREWIYRQAFEMGRHIIGYEVQKVLAVIDWFSAENAKVQVPPAKLAVAGYGEGALLALYTAALDPRIGATLVSGYFDSRQRSWEEPLYRNLFGALREFGDAELASLVHPRALIIEHSQSPTLDGSPKPHDGRAGAAPCKWGTPDYASVEQEIARARILSGKAPVFIHGNEGSTTGPGSARALQELMSALGNADQVSAPPATPLTDARTGFSVDERQRRQVKELENFTQNLLRVATYEREKTYWSQLKAPDAATWDTNRKSWQTNFWENVMGKFSPATLPANARSRKTLETEKVTGYDVVLDVWPDVYAWGVLLLPKDLKPGERRPVVVCQHGLEGVPMDTITEDQKSNSYAAYKAFSLRLAERGFIVFAPHNPYRGTDKFRTLQRKANPLGKHLFSVIFAQHERILDWLSEQPFVDAKRIGFYGLSYGGKSAMRIPAVCDRYCLSICSADFNEWVWKNANVDWRSSYMFTGEYEIYEWNLGHTFNYAEMATLIAPRPFMVERGHDDGVGIDEWVSFEFAKIRRFYNKAGIGNRAEIEYFNGPHTINGQGTYDFLHRHLNWPKR
jgi:dienelactone hydrolase